MPGAGAPDGDVGAWDAARFVAGVAAVVRATRPGELVTYGEVAAEAGFPGRARAVARVLQAVDDLPWWRVVPASGRLPTHLQPRQRERLRAEGVPVDDDLRLPRRAPRAGG